MKKKERSRADRHAQTPTMRDQIKSLRTMVESIEPSGTGARLSINMVASFALELALKMFYMTFNENHPKNTHDLFLLWSELPQDWKDEISRRYAADPRSAAEIVMTGLQRAPSTPESPSEMTVLNPGIAEGLFKTMSDAFVRARYFYEDIEVGEWSTFMCAKLHMLAMIDVLTSFHEELANP